MMVVRLALPTLSPSPLMQPCTCTAPARTAASVLATPTPQSSWQWMPTTSPQRATMEAVTSSTRSGRVPPLVSQRMTRVAPAARAASTQRVAYSGFDAWPSKKCSASYIATRPCATTNAMESAIMATFSSSSVRMTSRTWRSQLLPTSVITSGAGVEELAQLEVVAAAVPGLGGGAKGP